MKLYVQGLGDVEIENWDEFQHKLLSAIGVQVVPAIQQEIARMKLFGTSDYWQSIQFAVTDDGLEIYSDTPYAPYLEYGTFEYYKQFGLESFPDPGYPGIPKKKELKPKDREGLPKGMQNFAPFRRVIYNPEKMAKVIQKAVSVSMK